VYAAWALQLQGYPVRAEARMAEALVLAGSLDHPFSLAYAHHFAAAFHQCRGERRAMQELEDAALAHATVHGFGLFLMGGAIHRGWLQADQGQGEEGLARMRQGLQGWRAIGAELRVPTFLALMADVHGKVGQPDEGLSLVSEALVLGERTGQRYWDAELYRLKGTLTLQRERERGRPRGTSEAEACFLEAIEVARRQGARSLELRAATHLARLWASRERSNEAHALLSAAYRRFTEGFETADLRDAKSVLDRLAGGTYGQGSRRR
jgi:predicted ATPase